MDLKRRLFSKHIAQTSELPLALEVHKAQGMYIWDTSGKRYIDMNSGISVSSIGHCHPAVVTAVKNQAEQHMHTMVYGEHLQSPQIKFAESLTSKLDSTLNSVYFLMAGTEAVELSMKLARKHTGRYEIISAENAYHGSTYGSESLRSDHDFIAAFAPGVPGIKHIRFNEEVDLLKITNKTSAVIIEPVQAESGVHPPIDSYLTKVRHRCNEVGALLVLDEIQTGFGRTGKLFAHQKYNITPDVLLTGKAMGGGMPMAAVIASEQIFGSLISDPMLGHITTFGGHPVSAAAAHACLETLINENIVEAVQAKEKLMLNLLQHDIIKEVRSSGLMMAVELTKRKYLKHVIQKSYELGLLIDYFLFNDRSFRLCPPLIISNSQIEEATDILLKAMDFAVLQYAKK